MTTKSQALVPIFIAAVIIGVVGLMTLPSDIKLESVEFPWGTIMVDDVPLQVQIADSEPRRIRGLMFQEQLPFDEIRIRYENWYHRRCVWHIAHLIRLDNFF